MIPRRVSLILEPAVCGAAIAFGVFLRVFRFWEPSLWLDELATAHVAAAPDLATLLQRSRLAFDPPLHHLLARVFLWFGANEFLLRLPSLLFGLGSIAILIQCLRRWMGLRGALYAGALFALNSRAILHSQDARMYGLGLFLTTLSIYALLRVIDGGGARWLVLYGVVTAALAYNHIVYTSVAAAEIAIAGAMWALKQGNAVQIRRLLQVQGLVMLAWVPLIPLVLSVRGSRTKIYEGWTAFPNGAWFQELFEWPEVIFLVMTVPGLLFLVKRRAALRPANSAESALLWLGMVLAAMWPAAIVSARLRVVNILQPRYLLPSLIGILLVAGFCLAKSNEPFLRIGMCVYLALGTGFQVLVAKKYGPWVGVLGNQDWRAASEWLQQRYRPGDVVLLRSGLAVARAWSPQEPGVQDFLACPLDRFYNRSPMTVVNLPWDPRDMTSSPYTPPEMQAKAQRAEQVFVLVNPLRDPWAWDPVEEWLGQGMRAGEKRNFRGLLLRVYRPASVGQAGALALTSRLER